MDCRATHYSIPTTKPIHLFADELGARPQRIGKVASPLAHEK
jgi:hypothetical protein